MGEGRSYYQRQQFLDFNSHHDNNHKISTAATLIHRAINLPNSQTGRDQEIKHVYTALDSNGYPTNLITELMRTSLSKLFIWKLVLFALSLAFITRFKATPKWPIKRCLQRHQKRISRHYNILLSFLFSLFTTVITFSWHSYGSWVTAPDRVSLITA